MKSILLALGIIATILSIPIGLDTLNKITIPYVSHEDIAVGPSDQQIPKTDDVLEPFAVTIKLQNNKKIITMEANNMIVLRGPVTGSSVGKAIQQLQEASRRVSRDTPIYLTLDTPGGDIVAGTDLIDFAKALPQQVHTITLFAASMGFQIAQNLNTRYVITNGQFMSHRARVSGLSGQVKGELESRYKTIRRMVDALDYVAAKRLGIDMKTYEQKIFNEYWVYGFDAVTEKAADEEVLLRCGASLSGTDTVNFDTLFGPIKVTFSKCPLIKAPLAIDFNSIFKEHRAEVVKSMKMSLLDKPRFVNEYITTSRFSEIFK